MIWTISAREKLRSGTTSDEPGSIFMSGANSWVFPSGVMRRTEERDSAKRFGPPAKAVAKPG